MSYLQNQIASLLRSAAVVEPIEPYYEVLSYITFAGGTSSGVNFDTGIIPNPNLKIDCTFRHSGVSSNNCVFGGRIATSGSDRKAFAFWNYVSGYMRADFGNTSSGTSDIGQTETYDDTWVNIVYDKNKFYLNGTLKWTSGVSSFTASDEACTITIGAMNSGTSSSSSRANYFKGDIQQLKIWDDDVLVRDYIPVLDSQMRPCLYDRVNKTFTYSTITPTYSRWNKFDVDYIESSGTQYINTGYAFADDFAYEIEYKGLNNGECLLGGRTSSVRTAILYRAMATQVDGQTTVPIAGLNATQTPFKLGVLSDTKHTIKVAIANNKGNIWVDDTQIYTNQSFTGTYISDKTTAIFADHFGDQTGASEYQEYATSQLYALKFWQGTNLVRDYKPVVWHNGNTTAVACLYDEVYNKMYTNAGTGSFKAYVAPETTVYTLNDGVQNDDYYLAENGVKTASADHTSCYSNAFAVKQGDIIEWTVTAEQVSANKRIHGYTTNDDIEVNSAGSWVQMLAKIVFSTTSDTTQTATFTVPSGINYIRVSHANVRESVCTIKRIRTYEVGKSISNGQGAGYDLSVPYSNNFVFEAITACKTTGSNYFMDTRKVISGGSATYQSDTGAFGVGGSSSGATMNWKDGTGNNTIIATDGTNWSRTQGSLPFRYNAKLVGWDEDGNHKRTAIFYHFGSGKNSDRVVTNGSNIENNRATITLLYTTNSNVLGSGSDLSYVYFAQDGNVEYDVIPVRNATVTSDVLLLNRANNTRVTRLTISGSPSITFNALD